MKSSTYLPVTEALYHAARKPTLGKKVLFDRGFCGRCRRETDVADAAKILSRSFGSWDDVAPDPQSKRRHLCLPCGWAYRAKELQYHPTILSPGAQHFDHPSGSQLRQMLGKPIPADALVLFPVSGKKALAPRAQWGKVTTDFGALTWTRRHAQAVKDLMELKALGIREATMTAPAPPGYTLDSLDAPTWSAVQDAWKRLAPMRADKTLFPALVKMTREKM